MLTQWTLHIQKLCTSEYQLLWSIIAFIVDFPKVWYSGNHDANACALLFWSRRLLLMLLLWLHWPCESTISVCGHCTLLSQIKVTLLQESKVVSTLVCCWNGLDFRCSYLPVQSCFQPQLRNVGLYICKFRWPFYRITEWMEQICFLLLCTQTNGF